MAAYSNEKINVAISTAIIETEILKISYSARFNYQAVCAKPGIFLSLPIGMYIIVNNQYTACNCSCSEYSS